MKLTAEELANEVGEAIKRAHDKAGDKVYDIHIFLQTYPTLEGPDYWTVHCDQSYIPYDQREEHEAAEQAVRDELPNAVIDIIDFDEDLFEDGGEAFAAAWSEYVY